MIDKDAVLRQVPLFRDLSADHLQRLEYFVREKGYRKSEILFRTNDPGNTLFILRSGRVKVILSDRHGKEVILRVLQPGEFFGEMALLDGQSRSATVVALEQSQVLTLDRLSFLQFIERNPPCSLMMLAVLSRRLRKANEKIGAAVFSDAYGKVSRVLLDLIPEEGNKDRDGIWLDLKLTRRELAAMAGMTRETFTRILKEFERSGFVRTEGRQIVILKQADLSRETF